MCKTEFSNPEKQKPALTMEANTIQVQKYVKMLTLQRQANVKMFYTVWEKQKNVKAEMLVYKHSSFKGWRTVLLPLWDCWTQMLMLN